jgi:hypothetical protein
VLLSPGPIFAALRDDSEEAARARQEPVTALLMLAGIAGVLGTPVARHLLNDGAFSVSMIPVWAFIGGALYGLTAYYGLGFFLFTAARGLGSLGSYRRARHLLAYAATPLALSLLTLWPLRVLLYGRDLFRTGGDDFGRGDAIFGAVSLGFYAWCAVLLAIGIRAVHGWTWPRSLAAVVITALLPTLLVLASVLR